MGRKRNGSRIRWAVRIELILVLALMCVAVSRELTGRWKDLAWQGEGSQWTSGDREAVEVSAEGNYIKWVDFNITCEALAKAYELDVESYQKDIHLDWIELLAYAGAATGGKFDQSSLKKIGEAAEKIAGGETTMERLTEDMEYYDYYLEAYSAVLGGMVGEFSLKEDGRWKRYYGLKAFSPIAKGFDYSHYDDFGSSRSYGYSRPHLGHDMMGQIGTPIRIKNRTCALKNNAQVLVFQNTFLNNLADQFVFCPVFYGIKVVKQITDTIVYFRFGFLNGLAHAFL